MRKSENKYKLDKKINFEQQKSVNGNEKKQCIIINKRSLYPHQVLGKKKHLALNNLTNGRLVVGRKTQWQIR